MYVRIYDVLGKQCAAASQSWEPQHPRPHFDASAVSHGVTALCLPASLAPQVHLVELGCCWRRALPVNSVPSLRRIAASECGMQRGTP